MKAITKHFTLACLFSSFTEEILPESKWLHWQSYKTDAYLWLLLLLFYFFFFSYWQTQRINMFERMKVLDDLQWFILNCIERVVQVTTNEESGLREVKKRSNTTGKNSGSASGSGGRHTSSAIGTTAVEVNTVRPASNTKTLCDENQALNFEMVGIKEFNIFTLTNLGPALHGKNLMHFL